MGAYLGNFNQRDTQRWNHKIISKQFCFPWHCLTLGENLWYSQLPLLTVLWAWNICSWFLHIFLFFWLLPVVLSGPGKTRQNWNLLVAAKHSGTVLSWSFLFMIQLFRNCFPLLLETKNLDVRKEYECEKTFLNAIYEQVYMQLGLNHQRQDEKALISQWEARIWSCD